MEQIIYIKMDLALNSLQRLICHKTQQTKQTYTVCLTMTKKSSGHLPIVGGGENKGISAKLNAYILILDLNSGC